MSSPGHTIQQISEILRQHAQDTYSDLAGTYDQTLLDTFHYQSHRAVAQALKILKPAPHAPWLDLGCGTGLVGTALKEAGLPLALTGMDLSAVMITQAPADIYEKRVLANAALSFPFNPQTFDGVVCAGLMEHMVSPAHVAGETARVLKPGGFFLLTAPPSVDGSDWNLDPTGRFLLHHPQAIAEALQQAGFALLHQMAFNAYLNGTNWQQHVLFIAQRTS